MDPESGGSSSIDFSSCSIRDVCDKIPYLGSCLKEPGTQKNDLIAVCGNGIREGNEECDCGGKEGCLDNKCCTADCKLTPGSTCSDNNDVCCRGCKTIAADDRQVCRVAASTCQEDTFCDGFARGCPNPVNKPDGEVCEEGATCASGVCTSRDMQCSIFGRHLNITQSCKYTGRSCSILCQGPDQCVDMNASFLDGTKCGEKGFCYAGMCSEMHSQANSKVIMKVFASMVAIGVGLL
ncbi:Zinc metalloprotease [Paramicrosporidium saccamoebae]|uniref:Disintegrin and metalloproteinase domain-containing protein B n=1 Tax=Paramicrosporidium saccamoebae TaxID=1246581 RepID=A0A2H9TII0_9FUNG|nr:Zinc metalloprotease [Paramicrosporidium saccamoebae]